jgi:diadenosine tetraphosphate (Ap4A) HIT family hydrolase
VRQDGRVSNCVLCEFHRRVDAGDDPWSVARLQTGYVGLNPLQYFRGYTFFGSTLCVREIYDLDAERRALHLHEMAEVAIAVERAFGADKMNLEALGNGVPHLHWHVVPRREHDLRPRAPIWEDLDFLRLTWTDAQEPDDSVRTASRAALLEALDQVDVTIERAFV